MVNFSHSSLFGLKVPGICGSEPLTGAAHRTASQWSRVVPSVNTWSQSLAFMILMGTSHQA
jgi:hypothetical protein